MPLRVSLAFLEEPIPNIIAKANHIADVMKDNSLYKSSPISAQGLKMAVAHLREMEKIVKSGKHSDVDNRNSALEDVTDFILQIAEFMNHCSDPKKLTDNGFEFTTETQKTFGTKIWNGTGGLM